MSNPLARKDDLVIRRLVGETVVSDTKNDKVHCLNTTSSWVWDHCDGKTSLADLAAGLHKELGLPKSEELVQLAVTQLDRRGLLEQAKQVEQALPVTPATKATRALSRRDALRALAAAAVALPLVMTVSAKTARAETYSYLMGCLYYSATYNTSFASNEGGPCAAIDGSVGTCRGGACIPAVTVIIPPVIVLP